MSIETLAKLYLELDNLLPATVRSSRQVALEITLERAIKKALSYLDLAPREKRNGPIYQAADCLREAIGLPPAEIGGKFSGGIAKEDRP